MADTPGKDTPSTDPKAQAKTGPVKPPVLEGTARPAAEAKPAEPEKPTDAPASTQKPETPRGSTSSSSSKRVDTDDENGAPWIAGILGGAIGLGAAYGLAWFGLWPTPPQSPVPTDPRIGQFAAALPELQTVTGTLQDELSTLNGRMSGLESDLAALPASADGNLDSGLADRLATLAAQVETLSTAPAPDGQDTADLNAEAITSLETALAELRQEASNNAARLAETESQIAGLTETASANADAETGAVRLPLIFSSLESAFASGRAYEVELAALRQAWPDVTVPEALSASAASGLPRPDDVVRRLDNVVPDMLAGRPANTDANWQDGAMDWVRGIVAMRPSGSVEGDGPEAIVARLEAAIARRDFTAAQVEIAALPETMRNAAGAVLADIATLAEAESFLADLRSQALAGEDGA